VSRAHRSAGALAAVAGVACLLAACSSGTTPSTTTTVPGQTSAPTTSAPTTSAPTTSAPTTTVPFNQGTNARADVTTGVCQANAAGLWLWSGTVANRTSHPHTYTIIVDFTDAVATVLQTKVVTVRALAPGKTAGWTASGASGHKSVLCVIRSARLS
jgi:hypothetical protein